MIPLSPEMLGASAASRLQAAVGAFSRLDLSQLLDQRGRLIQLDGPLLPQFALVPERLVLKEAVNAGFELTLDVLSVHLDLDLGPLVGEEITVRLLQPDGSYRPWHGLVFDAYQLGSDGGLARYRLMVRPWIALLAMRRDAFIWQDKTAVEVLDDLFSDYACAHVRFDVSEPQRKRRLCTQYRETDLEFMTRVLAEESLSYWFEHLADSDDAALGNAAALPSPGVEGVPTPPSATRHAARHRLVIGDRAAAQEHLGTARFTGQHVTANLEGQRDSVTAFIANQQVTTTAVSLGSWNARLVAGVAGQATAGSGDGDLPAFEHYDGTGHDRYDDAEHAAAAAQRMLAVLRAGAQTYEGAASARHFAAGRRFALVDHWAFPSLPVVRTVASLIGDSSSASNEFTLLSVEHHASNNLGVDVAKALRLTDLENGTYRNRFRAVPSTTPLWPAPIRKPTAPGVQVGVVVGVDDADASCDRDHRIHIQMPWQRGALPLAGGLAHASLGDEVGNAPGDTRSGAPVRMALPAAGADWGATLVPRKGTEVAVAAADGDIDHWIVIGQLYNGRDRPPYPSGEASGANHPGVISGMRVPSADGSAANEWVIDDATGQLRMRLSAAALQSELVLGHLIRQPDGSAERAQWLGSGFTASTAGWTSLRAGKGMLLTTSARDGTYGSAHGTQMGAGEALQQIKSAQKMGQQLGTAASSATGLGLPTFDNGADVARMAEALDPRDAGKHPDEVHGQPARQGVGRDDHGDPVEAMATPMIVLDSTSAAALVSPASIVSFSGQALSLASQGDLHATALRTYAAVSGGTTSFYTQSGDIKLIAATGPISMRAHQGELQILADQDVSVVSVDGEILIQARSRIELISGSSSIELAGGNITFKTPGAFEVKHTTHALLPGASKPAPPLRLPQGKA